MHPSRTSELRATGRDVRDALIDHTAPGDAVHRQLVRRLERCGARGLAPLPGQGHR